MSKKTADSEFKRAFLARTAAARANADYTQETMAAALGMEPHALMVQFCTLCHIDMAWLYTAAIEIPAAKPRRRRRPRKFKAA